MILRLSASLLSPVIIGFLLVCLLWPIKLRSHLLLKCCLAVGIGYGVASCLFFLALLSGQTSTVSLVTEILTILGLSAALIFSRRKRKVFNSLEHPGQRQGFRTDLVSLAFLCALAMALMVFASHSQREPHGGNTENWDSWGQLNLRARFIHRLGDQWSVTFSQSQAILSPQHPDYPLLLPLNVARCWNHVGTETTIVPIMLAWFFTFASIGLIVSSLSALRNRAQGYLGGLVLIGLPVFIEIGAWQYADVPLALCFLMTLVLFSFYDTSSDKQIGLLILAGISAGLAAWTKNEGWLFILALMCARWFAIGGIRGGHKLYLKQIRFCAVGLLPVAAIVILFKLRFALTNDLVSGLGLRSTLGRIVDPSRYFFIIRISIAQILHSAGWLSSLWALVPFALLLGGKVEGRNRPAIITSALTLTIVLMGYFFVYVITPFDLSWHLQTSVLRLLIQVWPSFVLTYFLIVNTLPEAQ